MQIRFNFESARELQRRWAALDNKRLQAELTRYASEIGLEEGPWVILWQNFRIKCWFFGDDGLLLEKIIGQKSVTPELVVKPD